MIFFKTKDREISTHQSISSCKKYNICKSLDTYKFYICYAFEGSWLNLMDKNFKKRIKFDNSVYFETEEEAQKFCERHKKIITLQ